jgi:hypothetical protein
MSTKPQVLAWITCDSVYVDPATGKHTLLGIFSNLRAKEFPVVHPRMIWFLSFSDLTKGKHQLKISIGIPMSEEEPRYIIDRNFESPGPPASNQPDQRHPTIEIRKARQLFDPH